MDTRTPGPGSRKHRVDHLLIAGMVTAGARVLDVGCGDGDLLELLAETRQVDGRGIEKDRAEVSECVARGLSVIHGDADTDLAFYPDKSFDYAVLSLTIQATKGPKPVLENLLRIGRHAIVSFPNFAHWRPRLKFTLLGRMPVTDSLPYRWYDTPNIHLCSIRDFLELCGEVGAEVEQLIVLDSAGRPVPGRVPTFLQNFVGTQAVLLLTRNG
ncbi:MAG: methionine biosynthesis protein MetW [Hyphomicrobiaceae bacterium]